MIIEPAGKADRYLNSALAHALFKSMEERLKEGMEPIGSDTYKL